LQNTSLCGRLGFGGTDFRNDPYTVLGGLQTNWEDLTSALKLIVGDVNLN
jgi:hypothetical protein